jgi:hypothetical protein
MSHENQSQLPATSSATPGSTASQERRLSVTDPHPGDDERTAALRAWAREKEYANDYYGGEKGAVTQEAKDPLKPLKALVRTLSHQKKNEDEQKGGPREYAIDGEIGVGEMDTSVIV